jgi:hypothetical protein
MTESEDWVSVHHVASTETGSDVDGQVAGVGSTQLQHTCRCTLSGAKFARILRDLTLVLSEVYRPPV